MMEISRTRKNERPKMFAELSIKGVHCWFCRDKPHGRRGFQGVQSRERFKPRRMVKVPRIVQSEPDSFWEPSARARIPYHSSFAFASFRITGSYLVGSSHGRSRWKT